MLDSVSTGLFDHYFGISRLLAGQLDFHSAITAVDAEINDIIPHDHLDVCIVNLDGQYHTAYESGVETGWSRMAPAPICNSPIRALLWAEVDYLLTDDACTDPRFHFEGAFAMPIFELGLHSRLHVPLKVQGNVIGVLSCSSRSPALYSTEDVANARAIADLLAPYFYALRAAEQAKRSAIIEAEARAREEGLRAGARKLTEALEAERQRIGMDLHDETLADLTRLARRLERLIHQQEVPGDALEPLFRNLQHCMQDLRQIIEEARPSVLQLFGFAEAVENHLDRSIRDSGSDLAWDLRDESGGAFDALDQTVTIALFRITQEAINNAIRHAAASQITVLLEMDDSLLSIKVCDDGKGFERLSRRPGHGIDNMKTRARLISAKFDIATAPTGKGTRVRVTLPLAEAKQKEALS